MRREKLVTLAYLATTGASAFGLTAAKKMEFEKKFGVEITSELVVEVLGDLRRRLADNETVIVDGRGD